MTLPDKLPDLPGWAWAGIGFAAVWLLFRPKEAGKLAGQVGQGAANVATGVFTGLAEGLFGIPQTDAEKCKAALSAGQTYEASKVCPAGQFIGGSVQSFSDWLKGLAVPPPKPFSHGGFTGKTVDGGSATTPSILNGGSFETQSNCVLLGVDCDVTGSRDFDVGDWIEQQNQQNRTITPVAGTRG